MKHMEWTTGATSVVRADAAILDTSFNRRNGMAFLVTA